MSESNSHAVTAEAVQQAGKFIMKTIDNVNIEKDRSPAFNQLAAAKQETDPATRATKKAEALKKGLRETHAEVQRLKATRDALAAETGKPELTPEALRELEILKSTIRRRIRQKTEEEIARTYPEIASDKKRRAPRRHRINI